MGLAEITSRDAVLDAIDEYEDLGADAFLQRYGDGLSRELMIEYISQKFAALPVLRVAHRVITGDLLDPAELENLPAAKARLEALKFRVLGDVGPVRKTATRARATSGAARPASTRSRATTKEQPVQQRRQVLQWKVQPDDLVTRRDLAKAYGATLHGVIDTSPRSESILVFAAPAALHHDGWTADGQAYLLTGEGRRGDQSWTPGNQALVQHQVNGWTVRLFEECDEPWRPGGKRYRYLGAFGLDPDQPWTNETISADPDTDEQERTVICFRLLAAGSDEDGSGEPGSGAAGSAQTAPAE